ncbi:DUF805 domain-containing protein [Polymorphum gilvum]|uniref:DUF805 domain-containing protein n=1 Tax=Polymorphum gilvum (strain LMG 25793 / CGMCC 1.9160 / SL003B-26A1) TaxID=991905 RepID=F2J2P4_POLGS|nr:DUF805 domain-containing protein [Polymorphum gilvum]ADZ72068.1 hypothetical protein SL003B_3647 [Polymorphum gilvum SL003B-26A1]
MAQAPFSANITPGFVWLFLSPIGRLSREPYWLGFLMVWAVIAIAARMWFTTLDPSVGIEQLTIVNFMDSNPLFPFLFLFLQWVELSLVIKRLQDAGLTGFLALLIFVPLLNVVVILVLGFLPGTAGPNRYGPVPNSYYRRK